MRKDLLFRVIKFHFLVLFFLKDKNISFHPIIQLSNQVFPLIQFIIHLLNLISNLFSTAQRRIRRKRNDYILTRKRFPDGLKIVNRSLYYLDQKLKRNSGIRHIKFLEFVLWKICKQTQYLIEKMNMLDQAQLSGKDKRNMSFDFE